MRATNVTKPISDTKDSDEMRVETLGSYHVIIRNADNTQRKKYSLSKASNDAVIVDNLGALLHRQVPETDNSGSTLYEDFTLADFSLIGAPQGSDNVYFRVMPIGPGDDPFSYILARFNTKQKTFSLLRTSELFGPQRDPTVRTTPDNAAILWIPRGPGEGGYFDQNEQVDVYEPRTMYLIDLEKDTSRVFVRLPQSESFNAYPLDVSIVDKIDLSVSDDGVAHYTVYSIARRSAVFKKLGDNWSDPTDPAMQPIFAQEHPVLRAKQTGHGIR
jgi:hypothetical protein